MRRVMAGFLWVFLGCGDDGVAPPVIDAGPPPPPDAAVPLVDVPLAVSGRAPLDILFVVDNSGAMRQEQEALATGFPALLEPLADQDGGLPDLHIGIVSSNVGTGPTGGGGDACAGNGDNGVMQVGEGFCPALTDGSRYLIDVLVDEAEGTREFNYTGDLASQFACMVQLGTQGCAFEQHLEAMRRALSADNAANAGFVRDSAALAVIIVADEDDCSASDRDVFDPAQDDLEAPLGQLSSFRCFEFGVACAGEVERETGPRRDCVPDEESVYIEKVSAYAAGLAARKGPRQVAVMTISGPTAPVEVGIEPGTDPGIVWVEPACVVCPDGASSGCPLSPIEPDGALTAGFPAIRLRALGAAFPIRSHSDICAYGDGALDFAPALARIGRHLVDQTATRCLSAAPADRDPDTPGLQPLCRVFDEPDETPIRPCDASAEPCFHLIDAPECGASELALVLDRGDTAVPPDSRVVLRCAE
ncbi:MAG TPA: hypothetical protein VFU21_14165 [Kofleriaceae bacterium]|nr:hypothetical protein [Kofleriaceae bacterium]